MSGGKGGSQTSKVQIPKEFLDPAVRNIARSEQMAQMGYMPYYGPEVAAFTPMQEQAMQSQYDAAAAFGMVPQGGSAMAGIPQATEYAGGIRGYGSGDLFEQSINEFQKRQPEQAAIYNSLFVGPDGNYNPPRSPGQPVMGGGGGDNPTVGGGGAIDQGPSVNNFVNDFNTGTGSFAGGGAPSMGPSISDLIRNTNNPGMPFDQGPYVVNTYTDIPGVGTPSPFTGGVGGVGGSSGGGFPGTPVSYPEGIPGDFPDGFPATPSPGGEPVNNDQNIASLPDLSFYNPGLGNQGFGGLTAQNTGISNQGFDALTAQNTGISAGLANQGAGMNAALTKQNQLGYFNPSRGLFGMIGA